MSFSDRPLTAIERARLAYELMVRRQRELTLRRRSLERSRTIVAIVVCASVVACILGVAIYNNWLPTSLRSASMSRQAEHGKFTETRTGQVRSFVKGDTCQELQFNNDRGVYVGGSLVPCAVETTREAPPSTNGARFNSIRDAFTSR